MSTEIEKAIEGTPLGDLKNVMQGMGLPIQLQSLPLGYQPHVLYVELVCEGLRCCQNRNGALLLNSNCIGSLQSSDILECVRFVLRHGQRRREESWRRLSKVLGIRDPL